MVSPLSSTPAASRRPFPPSASAARLDVEWNFAHLTQKDTGYASHGYHRYPAKYIPQLAEKLILENSQPGDLVVDPFGGCGTTAIEAKIAKRRAVAVDVNPVAVMISKAKINAIPVSELQAAIDRFWLRHENAEGDGASPSNERIDYWFLPPQKAALRRILSAVRMEKKRACREFLQCAFSNILKNCSMWHMKSNKPLYAADKVPADPVVQFRRQLKKMTRLNADYCALLDAHQAATTPCEVLQGDAAKLPVDDGVASLVVTSPPYVTSYEYADLHQLTALWMKWMEDLQGFRKDFIGSSYARRSCDNANSKTADDIVASLRDKNASLAGKAAVYFTDMNKVFTEFDRILRPGGCACIVIGDTELRGVSIQNTQVFMEQLKNLGFTVSDVIKRQVISKCIPATRDSKTGKFSSVKASDKMAYPTEQIIVAEEAVMKTRLPQDMLGTGMSADFYAGCIDSFSEGDYEKGLSDKLALHVVQQMKKGGGVPFC